MITLAVRADRSLVRAAGQSVRYLHLRLTAPPRTKGSEREPVHVAFVIDRSGSMGGSSIELAKKATSAALGHLAPTDRFTIVAFDDTVETVVHATQATPSAVREARARIEQVQARGSTALCEGWLTGAAQIDPAASGSRSSAIARCFLLTDGHANVGEADPTALAHHAAELRKRGVATTTFGLGAGFSEDLLQSVAAAGGGHFYFIEQAVQIGDFFASELGEALDLVARNVRVRVSHPALRVEPMVAYEVERERGTATIRLGDLCAEQVVDLVVRLGFADGVPGVSHEVEVRVDAAEHDSVVQSVRFSFADHKANDAQRRDVEVDREVAAAYAATARRKAVALNRQGAFDAAARDVRGTARNIRAYANGDAALERLAAQLESEAASYAVAMDELSRKRVYQGSTSVMKGREMSGKARKSS